MITPDAFTCRDTAFVPQTGTHRTGFSPTKSVTVLYQNDTEMLFPPRVIAALSRLRGPQWQALVNHVTGLSEDHPDVLGFMLMMVRLDGCLTCHADSYRALRGCTICAQQAVARFKGSDRELVSLWETARQDILNWQAFGITPAT